MELLANPTRDASLAAFLKWCGVKGIRALPAAPADIAMFVVECELMGIETLASIVSAVAVAHRSRGLADPTSGYPVAAALNRIAKINLPESWGEAERGDFQSLPYELQARISDREQRRQKFFKGLRADADRWRAQEKKASKTAGEK